MPNKYQLLNYSRLLTLYNSTLVMKNMIFHLANIVLRLLRSQKKL
jgi:hypothetical protein